MADQGNGDIHLCSHHQFKFLCFIKWNVMINSILIAFICLYLKYSCEQQCLSRSSCNVTLWVERCDNGAPWPSWTHNMYQDHNAPLSLHMSAFTGCSCYDIMSQCPASYIRHYTYNLGKPSTKTKTRKRQKRLSR